MRIFKNKWITKFADKQGISDGDLIHAVHRAENGQIDAELEGYIAKPGLKELKP